jgi:hypothetical protein
MKTVFAAALVVLFAFVSTPSSADVLEDFKDHASNDWDQSKRASRPALGAAMATSRSSSGAQTSSWRLAGRMLRQLSLQRAAMHFQAARGGRDIAVVLCEHALNVLPLEAVHR